MKRLIAVIILIPIAIIIVALALANRQTVNLSLPPELGYPPLGIPLYALFFGTLFIGMFLGSFSTWMKQGKYRKEAREQKVEATKMSFEADKQRARAEELADETSEDMSNEARAFVALGLPAPKKAA